MKTAFSAGWAENLKGTLSLWIVGEACDSVLVTVKGESRSLLLKDTSSAVISLQEDSAMFTKILDAQKELIHSSTVIAECGNDPRIGH